MSLINSFIPYKMGHYDTENLYLLSTDMLLTLGITTLVLQGERSLKEEKEEASVIIQREQRFKQGLTPSPMKLILLKVIIVITQR